MLQWRYLRIVLLLLLLSPTGCLFKKGKPPEEKQYDVYGTVQSVTTDELVIQTSKGNEQFAMVDSSVKGGDFGAGAYVHVFYRLRDNQKQVVLVVEKVDY